MRRPRVLHVHRDFAPHQGGGGVARHIHGLATTAAGLGFDVRVVAPRAATPDDRCDYDVHADARRGLWRHVGWADIVHVHGARTPITALAALLARLRGKRLVYTPHCYYDDKASLKQVAKRLWDHVIERRLLAASDATVLLAEFWRDELRARGLAAATPVILPNCVLGSAVLAGPARAVRLEGEPSLLSVGRLDPVKRLEDAIAALGRPELAQAVLHIVGRGPDRERLAHCAARAGVAARVRFHGFVADSEVAAMAAGAGCFVLPSEAEGGPTVLIEMLLMGCRIVASDIPANVAILQAAGWTEGLYPLGDVEALAVTAARVAQLHLPAEVTARTRDHFTWESHAARILALYGQTSPRADVGPAAMSETDGLV
ncbi:glycosyltransferase family 4 protein [Bradyrhizobium sp. HKCCYLS20291]|uniref:glycosyltransferase family 4 protein n=1 Tax=Bradyrhizobium sp. HKCCYLS20291 TaxID=3420766 RepID=UPI003EBBB99D